MNFKDGDHVILNDHKDWRITKPGSKGIIECDKEGSGRRYYINFYYIPGKGDVTNTRFSIECACIEPLITSFLDVK